MWRWEGECLHGNHASLVCIHDQRIVICLPLFNFNSSFLFHLRTSHSYNSGYIFFRKERHTFRSNHKDLVVEVDGALVTAEHIKAEDEIHVLVFEDSEGTGEERFSDLNVCRVHSS